MIIEKVVEAKEKKIKAWPVNANRASELGHECLRFLVLNRTRWQERALHDVRLQFIFDMGNEIEAIVMKELTEAGFQVIEQQRPFSYPEYNITGHIDGKIILNGQAYPFEVKSCSPFVFKTLNSIEDLTRGKYAYLRRYPTQLNLYLLMDNKERGVFLFKDKVSGQIKEIWMDLDYDLGEATLKKAEAINKHVKDGTLPDPIEYDDRTCGECPYVHICLPERTGDEVKVIDSEELLASIKRWEELKPLAKEYDEANEELNKMLEGQEKIMVGDYFITGKWQEMKNGKKFWRKTIAKVA